MAATSRVRVRVLDLFEFIFFFDFLCLRAGDISTHIFRVRVAHPHAWRLL